MVRWIIGVLILLGTLLVACGGGGASGARRHPYINCLGHRRGTCCFADSSASSSGHRHANSSTFTDGCAHSNSAANAFAN